MRYRMYCFVLSQLSTIQKGVQCSHAVAEYGNTYKDCEDYKKWLNEDKTLIVLDGGKYQDMINIMSKLQENEIKYEFFREPDLNSLVTAITVIADEGVWNYEKYPAKYDFFQYNPFASMVEETEERYCCRIGGNQNYVLRGIISKLKLAM